ncbi:MAG: ABC transporter permease, partial [Clostridiales bacterium]|nr:ABC transporter permease [Clostridiales bacterium]
MIRYIVKRLVMMIPILLGISFIVLILIDISPGDVARIIVGSEAEEWEYQQVREELRLDDPLLV